MIKSNNIIKTMGEKMILRGVNLHISEGETVAILGPNGVGKSTWLKIVAGLMQPTEGQILIHGKRLRKDHFEQKEMLGYLGHRSFLYEQLTPVENLKFFARLYHLKNPDEKIDELIKEVGLTFFKNDPVQSFSRGMVQRLAIARAILHGPKILLLDEPHTGLDQRAIEILNQVILRLKNLNITVVMVTHDFSQVIKTCNRVVILKNGKVNDDIQLNGQGVAWLNRHYERQSMS